MINLSTSRELSIYFENNALGMSLEYGLQHSLIRLYEEIKRIQKNFKIDDNNIYKRIVFFDDKGKILADTRQDNPLDTAEENNELRKHIVSGGIEPEIDVAYDGSSLQIILSTPYFFKHRQKGQILAFVNHRVIYKYIHALLDESRNWAAFLYYRRINIPLNNNTIDDGAFITSMSKIDDIRTGEIREFTANGSDGKEKPMIALRFHIKDTPFSILAMLPRSDVYGYIPPWGLLAVMILLSLIIFLAIAITMKIGMNNLVLNARLEETAKKEHEVAEMNQQLIEEMTRRKGIEQTLRDNEETFRTISSSANDAIIMINDKGDIKFWNQAAEKIFGYNAQDVLDKELHTIIAPQRYINTYKKNIGIFQKHGQGYVIGKPLEFEAVRKDGTEFPIELSVSAVKLKNRWKGIGILRDISARKDAEERLRASEEKHRTILENIEEGYFEVDLAGNLTFFNDALCKITNGSENTLFGLNYREYTSSETAQTMFRNFNKVYRTGEPSIMMDYDVTKKDGSRCILEMSTYLIKNSFGTPIGFSGIIRDVTKRRHAEDAIRKSEEKARKTYEELKDTQAQLVQSGKLASIGELASGVAHELNQPLMVIRGNTQLLKRGLSKDMLGINDVLEQLEPIERNTKRMMNIINHLRTFSRQSKGDFSDVNLNKTIKESFLMVGEQLRIRNIDVEWIFGNAIPMIIGSANQLEQVFLNLITNARDAMNGGGRLSVTTRYDPQGDNGYVEVFFRDTGKGIDPESLDKIFDPFFTTKEVGKGTGLGLSISYGIIQEHKGAIKVADTGSSGTTFMIMLPVAPCNTGKSI